MGNSQLPGTDCTTIFASLTPLAKSVFFVPASSGSIMAACGVVSKWCDVVRCGTVRAGLEGGRRRWEAWGWWKVLTGIPARVDDSDAEGAAVVFLGLAGSFEGGVHFWVWGRGCVDGLVED